MAGSFDDDSILDAPRGTPLTPEQVQRYLDAGIVLTENEIRNGATKKKMARIQAERSAQKERFL